MRCSGRMPTRRTDLPWSPLALFSLYPCSPFLSHGAVTLVPHLPRYYRRPRNSPPILRYGDNAIAL
jgi:hypothetical protein